MRSHPARVRGLKFTPTFPILLCYSSHPARVRGLKFMDENGLELYRQVAPCTGAWIEISGLLPTSITLMRRTLHGCVDWNRCILFRYTYQNRRTLHGCVDWNQWLKLNHQYQYRRTLHGCVDWNNCHRGSFLNSKKSHPARVRGLKLCSHILVAWYINVAPCTGAWIEIAIVSSIAWVSISSHPARVRGLK